MEKTLNEMEGGRRVVGIVLLGPWDPQSPSCMSHVQSVSSLFALLPLSGLCAHGVTCHIFRKITARSFFFFPGAIQALPRGLGIGRKGPKWGKAVEAVALAV